MLIKTYKIKKKTFFMKRSLYTNKWIFQMILPNNLTLKNLSKINTQGYTLILNNVNYFPIIRTN